MPIPTDAHFHALHRLSTLVQSAGPNSGHRSITTSQKHLSTLGGSLTLATMNIDDLHEQAGPPITAAGVGIESDPTSPCSANRSTRRRTK